MFNRSRYSRYGDDLDGLQIVLVLLTLCVWLYNVTRLGYSAWNGEWIMVARTLVLNAMLTPFTFFLTTLHGALGVIGFALLIALTLSA